jgi:hypothetical protein
LITGGLKIFKNLFGFSSKSVVAPSYYKNEVCEKIYRENGIEVFQGDNLSHLGKKKGKFINKNTYNGKISNGVVSLCRNIFFEPSFIYFRNDKNFYIKILYKLIDIEYNKGNPLIICSHSYNYVSSLNKEMFEYSIKELDNLLNYIEKDKNNIYLNSYQLGMLYKNKCVKHGDIILQMPEKLNFQIIFTLFKSYLLNIFNKLILFYLRFLRKIYA